MSSLHPPHRPRLTQPDPPSRIQTLLRRGSKFRYSGRTLRQTQKAKLDRQDHNFTRYVCLSVCLPSTRQEDNFVGRKVLQSCLLFLIFCVMSYHTLVIRNLILPSWCRSYSERLHRKPTRDFAPGYIRARDSARLDNDDTTLTYVVGKQVGNSSSFSSSSSSSLLIVVTRMYC